ncbi:MAG: GDYXXLXY domain-containing protein [Pseudomonadota bacterium]
MIESRHARWLALAAVALTQSGVLAYMVYERVSLLASGREITLPVVPVDPRSLFRGDYVILDYDIRRMDVPDATPALRKGDKVFVTIAETDKGWKAVAADRSHPGDPGAGRTVLKGRIERAWSKGPDTVRKTSLVVRYGIESYFVPEGEGRTLEAKVRERKIDALIALGTDGTAAIKGLRVEGETVRLEPLL